MTRGAGALLAVAAATLCAALAVGLSRDPRAVLPRLVRVAVAGEVATGYVDARDRIVTVAHVLGGGGLAQVWLVGGPHREARAERVDRADDLAILAGLGGGTPAAATPRAAATPSSAAPPRGTETARPAAHTSSPIATSAAAALRVLVTREGRIRVLPATLARRIDATIRGPCAGPAARRPALELAVSVAPGDSGAPVLDRDGSVVGVVFARSTRLPGTAYAVDLAALGPRRP